MYDKQLINELFFELVRVSVGTAGCLSRTPNESEWGDLYAMAKKQSLVGVCFAGVQRLQMQEQCPPEMLYLTWMGMAAKIQQRNEVVNRQCVDLQKRLADDGYRSCILKGQGNAALYVVEKGPNGKEGKESSGACEQNHSNSSNSSNLSLLRQSGDIDIWVKGGYKKVASWLKTVESDCDFDDHHAHLHVYDDTDVEVHFTPYTLRHPIINKRLQRWFASQEDAQFSNHISIKDGELCVPTADFNLVYQLCHVYNHFFTEGVGLRQLMDYYFVLCDASTKGKVLRQAQEPNFKFQVVSEVKNVVSELGLERFAAALLWVIGYVFEGNNLETSETFQTLGIKPNESDGRFLLEEVMQSGNFGKSDERNKGLYDNAWNRFWVVHMKTFRLWRFDHWAWFWSPISRVYGFIKSKTR